MRTPLLFLAMAGLLRADLVEQGPKDAKPSGLLAGVARVSIDPPIPIAKLNWGSQTHIVAKGIDPPGLKATALVLSDGKQRFAMVDLDIITVEGLESAVEDAAARTGIPVEHIRLAASHTHAAPLLSLERGPAGVDLTEYARVYQGYMEDVRARIVEVIAAANAKLEPAHLAGGRGTGTININRRVRGTPNSPPAVGINPDGFVDRELIVFRIDNAQGRPLAVLANFQTHGTVLAYENELASPDWIGMARQTVEQAFPGSLCLYFQGAAGNQGPVEGFTGDVEVAHRLGRILGHQISAVAEQIDTVVRQPRAEGFVESTAFQAKQHWRVSGPRPAQLSFARVTVPLPRRTYSPEEIADMEQRIVRAQRQVAEEKAAGDAWKLYQAEARVRRFRNLLNKWKQPAPQTPVTVEMRVLRIGDVAMVSMPGEPFAEIGVAFKKASPFAFTMFCGYSSGVGGDYMPTAPEFSFGGYEIERTPYGRGAAEELMSTAPALFGKVK
jgi:hypothetical protein